MAHSLCNLILRSAGSALIEIPLRYKKMQKNMLPLPAQVGMRQSFNYG